MPCNDLPCDVNNAGAPMPVLEVVVHANRLAPFRGDSVFSVVDIGAAAIVDAPSLDQSLKSNAQASLFRRSSSLIANPTIQGLSLRAIGPSGAGRALVTLDGVPQSDPFGGWMIWSALPQEAIQSAHIVRGAGGGAYGAGALTGVVDLHLTSPQQDHFYANTAFSQSSGKKLDAGGSYAGVYGGIGVYYSTSTQVGDVPVRSPSRGAADVPTAGQDHSLLVTGQTALCPAGQCGELVVVAGQYSGRRETGVKGATADVNGDHVSVGFVRQASASQLGYKLQWWHRSSDMANRSVAIASNRVSTSLSNDQFATPAQATGGSFAIRSEGSHTANLDWELGVDTRNNEGEAQEYNRYVAQKPTRLRVGGGETKVLGAYAQGTKIADALTLTASARVDRWEMKQGFRRETNPVTNLVETNLKFADQQGTVATGRLGAAWALNSAQTLRAAVYNGFRLPTLNELYRPFRVGNDVTEANAALRPERLSGIELGARHKQGDAILDVDVFYNLLRDPITNVTLGAGPATFPLAGFVPAGGAYRQRQNLGEVRAVGVEVQGQYPLSSAINLVASATWTHARLNNAQANPVLNGKRPAQAPDYIASTGVEYHAQRLILGADVGLEGGSFEDDLNSLKLKPYQTLGLHASYQFDTRISAKVQVLNAFDKDIQIARSADGITNLDNGRRVWVSLAYRY